MELGSGPGTVRAAALSPVLLLGSLLISSLGGLNRWRSVMVTNLTPFITALVGIAILLVRTRLFSLAVRRSVRPARLHVGETARVELAVTV